MAAKLSELITTQEGNYIRQFTNIDPEKEFATLKVFELREIWPAILSTEYENGIIPESTVMCAKVLEVLTLRASLKRIPIYRF